MTPDRARARSTSRSDRPLGERLLELDAWFDATAVRVALSALILISVLPLQVVDTLRLAFLVVFSVEVSLRAAVFIARSRLRGERTLSEILFLFLDFLATASFLPIDMLSLIGVDTSVLRLVRAARMLLLLAYWGPLFRDFFQIALRRERLYQFGVIAVFAVLLTASGAAAMRLFDLRDIDTDGNGIPGEVSDWELHNVLWWSFRQVQDPGNMIQKTDEVGLLVVSLTLTGGGMLLVAFLIGIGANLVEEVFRAGRYRPLNTRDHTIILNAGPESLGVLVEISSYYRKQLSKPRMVVVGESPERPDFLNEPHVRQFRYLPGRPTDLQTLARASVAQSRRVVLLAPGSGHEADAATVTSALAVLDAGGETQVAAEVNHPQNADLLDRPGKRTIPVLARRLASLVLGQVAVSPGLKGVLDELLSSDGSEIYTCVSGEAACRAFPPSLPLQGDLAERIPAVHAASGVILIGVLTERERRGGQRTLAPRLNPTDLRGSRGLIGVADRFRSLREVVEACHADGGEAPVPPPSAGALVRVRTSDYPRKVLILGFHEDAVEIVDQLVRLCEPGLELRVLVGTVDKRQGTLEALREQLEEPGDLPIAAQGAELHIAQPGGTTRVLVEARDRLTGGLYAEALLGEGRPDTIIILRRDREDLDPDAATVLGVLRLMEVAGDARGCDLPHLLVELSDPDKAELLRKQTVGHPIAERMSLVCTEVLRQRVLAQSFFVPGLSALYRELLTAGAQELLTFDPIAPATFGELLATLPPREGVIPIAVATEDPDAPFRLRVHVSPPPRFGAAECERIVRIYAVGPSERRTEAQRRG